MALTARTETADIMACIPVGQRASQGGVIRVMDAVAAHGSGWDEFRLLGAVQLHIAGEIVALRGKHRSMLSVLLLHANEVVSIDQLTEALWGWPPPGNASGRVRTLVSELRRMWGVGETPIVTESPGNLLRLTAGQLDLDQFATGVERARQAGRQLPTANRRRRWPISMRH
ncbi:AfsR/SARP family transcriptional regulator [Micromonospora sediminicola]|uniref:AfsR/SARP family transcriptional regulator n=1 Tax=Micromonospora sediminicola TaxID=946078 RepID=UPI0037B73DFD